MAAILIRALLAGRAAGDIIVLQDERSHSAQSTVVALLTSSWPGGFVLRVRLKNSY
jgi:hypothetical protein